MYSMDEKLQVAEWYHRLKAETNERFFPLFFDESRYLVLKGGGGSGKSIFAGRKVLERCVSEPGHRWLVVRKVARTLRESCFEQLKNQAQAHYAEAVDFIPHGKGGDLYLRFKNGSEILFAGLDDVEKLKSIYDITGIWIEEASELKESDFQQLDIRLRGDFPRYQQIILSFNPVSVTHWLKRRFFDEKDPRACVHESTYLDNRFLPPEAIATLENFRGRDEYYYQVYCLGEWGVTGKTVFQGKQLLRRLGELKKPAAQGGFCYEAEKDGVHIASCSFREAEDGALRIYLPPEKGHPYVIGADTAGEGSDWFVAQVIDNVTGVQAAVLRQHYDEDVFAKQLYCLGKYYNDALLAPEVNFSTFPTRLLSMMGYGKLYVREQTDSFSGELKQAFGFRTDRLTRPNLIANLIAVLRDHAELLNDEQTIYELLSFVRRDELRAEAEPGTHDDCVMALAIAHYVRPQQKMRAAEEKVSGRLWREDQWEDYFAADTATRKYLVEKWGNPK